MERTLLIAVTHRFDYAHAKHHLFEIDMRIKLETEFVPETRMCSIGITDKGWSVVVATELAGVVCGAFNKVHKLFFWGGSMCAIPCDYMLHAATRTSGW